MEQNKIRVFGLEIERNFFYFIVAMALMGVGVAVENSSLANRLYDDLHLTLTQRTSLEFPRELPGLIGVVFLSFMASLGDVKSLAIACFIASIGFLCFGLIPPEYMLVVVTMFMFSTGQHLALPLNSSVSMKFAKNGKLGKVLGEIQSLNTMVIIITSALLYLCYQLLNMPIWMSFVLASIAYFISGCLLLKVKLPKEKIQRKKMLLRKEYSLYYILSTVNGARKQLTFTFVPWLIIDIFDKPVTTVTLLYFTVAVINVFFKPYLGRLIDRRGERFVLMAEAALLIVVSLGFAMSKTLFSENFAFGIVVVCYILDQLLMAVSMARATYASRIALTPEDVSPTLAMGMSFDHMVATTLPLALGFVWAGSDVGYVYVFLFGVVISTANLFLATKIKKQDSFTQEVESVA